MEPFFPITARPSNTSACNYCCRLAQIRIRSYPMYFHIYVVVFERVVYSGNERLRKLLSNITFLNISYFCLNTKTDRIKIRNTRAQKYIYVCIDIYKFSTHLVISHANQQVCVSVVISFGPNSKHHICGQLKRNCYDINDTHIHTLNYHKRVMVRCQRSVYKHIFLEVRHT